MKTISNKIGDLTCLKKLSLSFNCLTSIPTQMCNLINLTNLNLSNNQLETLPREISHLISLITLDISFNKFQILQEELAEIKTLKNVIAKNLNIAVLKCFICLYFQPNETYPSKFHSTVLNENLFRGFRTIYNYRILITQVV